MPDSGFEPLELPDAEQLDELARQALTRALDHALRADAGDVAALRLGVEVAHDSIMMFPPASTAAWEQCVRVCRRALETATAGAADDPELLALGAHAARLAMLLRSMTNMVGHWGTVTCGTMVTTSSSVSEDIGFGAFQMQHPTAEQLDSAANLQLTSTQPSDWLIEDEPPQPG